MNIKQTVSRSFEGVRDFRLGYDLEEKGASALISKTFTSDDAEERRFYRRPELAEGEETKLAILYGETMITPYIIDLGSGTGTQDPSQIQKTIRFIAGDGETEGIVIGPNGSPLENVYIGEGDETPQPVVDNDGRPSTSDVILATALGGAITSIPAIWNIIKDGVADEDKVGNIDPVTGAPVKTRAQRAAEKQIGENLFLKNLADVDDTVEPGTDYVLVFDNCTRTWTAKHINDLIKDGTSITGATGGDGGDGGTGGTGGDGGDGGTGDTSTPVEQELPDTDLSKETGNTQSNTLTDMIELPDVTDLTDNQYKEDLDVLGTNGIRLHFYAEGIGREVTWDPANNSDAGSDFPCIVNPNTPSSPGAETYISPGQIIIKVCLTATICGTEYLFYDENIATTGATDNGFSFTTDEILWRNTPLNQFLSQYPGQVFNSSTPNITVRLRRIDGLENGVAQSFYPVHYQGVRFINGEDYYYTGQLTPTSTSYALLDAPIIELDDGFYPDQKPLSSGYTPEDCPELTTVTPGQPPTPGEPGQPGDAGTPGTPGDSGSVTVADAPPIPTLIVNTPVNVEYCKSEGASTFDPTVLPTISTANSNIVDTSVTVTYRIISGEATFTMDGALPGGVVASGTGTRELTLTGPQADMPAASAEIRLQAADTAQGTIRWALILANSDDSCNGSIYKATPCELVVTQSQSACASISFDTQTSDTGTAQVYASLPNALTTEGTVIKELTSGPVSKTNGQTKEQFATAVAADITANVLAKNALGTSDPNYLPLYTATALGAVITVCAPQGGGADFNGFSLDAEYTGLVATDPINSFLTFIGGVTKNVSDFITNNERWAEVTDVLLGIGGNIAGAVITNILLNNTSSIELSIPDEDDVTVAFLYRGRKVNVPTEYDEANRTGTPDYDVWGGTYKKVYTDNPAWCLLDYIENEKFGLGQDLVFTSQQKVLLERDIFKISAYCDEVVDGDVRFRLNTAITDGTKIQILEQLCSVFFGSYVFHKGGLRIRADMPDPTPVLLVNQTNADEFIYEHTTLKSFVNKVEVTYVEPGNFYNQETVKAENAFGIQKYGEKAAKLFGFGITNREQALRYANWVLNSEIENALVVTYRGGWDHYRLVPGDIVQFEDSNERGSRLGGRVQSVTGTTVVFDGATVANVGDSISLTENDGTVHETTIASVTSSTEVELSVAPSGTVDAYSLFIVADQTVGKQLYRVVKVDETSDGNFSTTLQLYNLDKYNKIQAVTRAA